MRTMSPVATTLVLAKRGLPVSFREITRSHFRTADPAGNGWVQRAFALNSQSFTLNWRQVEAAMPGLPN